MKTIQTMPRVLAIDPTTKGFAYAVMEDRDHLLDWGIAYVNGGELARLKKIDSFLEGYVPDLLIIEDLGGSRRAGLGALLLQSIELRAWSKEVRVKHVSRAAVRELFAETGVTKHDIAVALADRFPELRHRLPRPRKPWESEDERMGIFDAVSFALTALAEI
jgi:hypothetical protein